MKEIDFAQTFEDNADEIKHTWYFLPKVSKKEYNIMIDGKNLFEQLIKNDKRTYDNIQKTATGQGDD